MLHNGYTDENNNAHDDFKNIMIFSMPSKQLIMLKTIIEFVYN